MSKIDFSQKLFSLDGEILKDAKGEFDLRAACVSALLHQEQTIKGTERLDRFNLAKDVHAAEAPLKLTSEQITLIKDCASKCLSTLAYGRVIEALDENPES